MPSLITDKEFDQLIKESMKRQSAVRNNEDRVRGHLRYFSDIKVRSERWYLGLFQIKDDNQYGCTENEECTHSLYDFHVYVAQRLEDKDVEYVKTLASPG